PVSCRIPFSALQTVPPELAVCPGRCPSPRPAKGSASAAGLSRQVVSFVCPHGFPPNEGTQQPGPLKKQNTAQGVVWPQSAAPAVRRPRLPSRLRAPAAGSPPPERPVPPHPKPGAAPRGEDRR